MIKRLSFIYVPTITLVVILVLVPESAYDHGTKQAEVPAGLPRIVSFKVASENVVPDEAPLFTWETPTSKLTTTHHRPIPRATCSR